MVKTVSTAGSFGSILGQGNSAYLAVCQKIKIENRDPRKSFKIKKNGENTPGGGHFILPMFSLTPLFLLPSPHLPASKPKIYPDYNHFSLPCAAWSGSPGPLTLGQLQEPPVGPHASALACLQPVRNTKAGLFCKVNQIIRLFCLKPPMAPISLRAKIKDLPRLQGPM